MEQEQQKQESPSQRASDLYSQYQNLRLLGSLGRLGGRLAVQVGTRAGAAVFGVLGAIGLPLWAFIGILTGIVLFVFVVVLAGPTGTTPTTEAGSFVSGPVRPPSGNFNTLRVNIENDYKISFVGFDDPKLYYNYLAWAWEKLEETKTTKFLELVKRGNDKITITKKADRCYNQATGPTTIEFSEKSCVTQAPYPKELFQIVFIHELTHIISAYNPNSRFEELKKILSLRQEDYLTSYSKNAGKCYGSNEKNEDYSEMIAYFLNPDFPEQDLGPTACKPSDETRTKNPYKTGKFPLHQKLAAEILGVSAPLTPAPVTALAKFSCPVAGGGPNILPSYQADAKDGHCGTDYNKKLSDPNDRCQGNTRRGKSIDIDTCQIPRSWEQIPPDYSTCGPNGKDVELPTIDGQRVDWKYIGDIPLTRKDCFDHEIVSGCGTGYIFKADLGGGKNWVLHLLHMGTTTIQPGETRPSGTIVGKTEAIHTHISIGQDVPDSDIKDQVKNYWKSVDTEMGLCQ